METLRALMERSYRDHPAFRFGAPEWVISQKKLAAFNDAYAEVMQFGATLSAASRSALRLALMHALDSVFSTFHAGSADKYETLFLLELKGACIRLLDDELVWYQRQLHAGCASLSNETSRRNAIRLIQDRYLFGCLSQVAVAELRALADREVRQLRMNVTGGRLRREDLSVNSGPVVRAIRGVLNREFMALGVLDAVSAYTGRKTRVIGLALELSVPQATWWKNAIVGLERPPQTLYAHLDETIRCPKSIVYLSDVSQHNGPTGCYPRAYESMQLNPLQELIGRVIGTVGTHPDSPLKDYYAKQYHQSVNSENFRRHFMRLPECLRFNSHMGWDVAPGSELESRLVTNECKMTGQAGTFIAFDGARLLHRGGLMQEGERVAIQVIFSDLTFAERALRRAKRMLS